MATRDNRRLAGPTSVPRSAPRTELLGGGCGGLNSHGVQLAGQVIGRFIDAARANIAEAVEISPLLPAMDGLLVNS